MVTFKELNDHREDGCSIILADKKYYQIGNLHQEDAPSAWTADLSERNPSCSSNSLSSEVEDRCSNLKVSQRTDRHSSSSISMHIWRRWRILSFDGACWRYAHARTQRTREASCGQGALRARQDLTVLTIQYTWCSRWRVFMPSSTSRQAIVEGE